MAETTAAAGEHAGRLAWLRWLGLGLMILDAAALLLLQQRFGGLLAATHALLLAPAAGTADRLLFILPFALALVTVCLGGMAIGYSRSWAGQRQVGLLALLAIAGGGAVAVSYLLWLPLALVQG
ncbi:MAG: hypothetical protein RBU45_01170 [Myxococcota bacterium]|jgi:hypothetical protein|nr:hypothetical protein [Myxococcota bacterium]